ncbi:calcium-binding protein [Sphingomonas corticis]|jgi:Ca2+-binding RTX toxin-like protein|uniref:Calcium-binding protein n=1 Tax=Sphingomonas corticis TaxID=2722791 RepID=A0ABX1CK58_9SPHN|nr:calcium-binding protein [Sphingomonas corticis]NJR78381.1 calcium-binding protein [Sphingomonas corticis]
MFSILNDIKYWGNDFWLIHPDFSPSNLEASAAVSFQNTIAQLATNLYNNASLTIAPILDAIGSAGGLRIGLSPDYPAAWIPENFRNNFNASYMLFDPSVNFLAFDETGRSFSVETRVVFAHELSHSTGRLDVASDLPNGATSDALMNTATFDHVGDNLRYEHQVSDELGISTKRLSYLGTFREGDSRFADYDLTESFSNDQIVSIVRLGDQATSQIDNDIDFSAYTSNPDVLAFGFTGDDTMKGSGGTDHFWGGTGHDELRGNGGADRLHGEAGDDRLYGGDGSDHLYGGEGQDVLRGEGGDDTIYVDDYDGGDTIRGGDGYDTVDYSRSNHIEIVRGSGSTLLGDATDNSATGDLLDGIERIIGSAYSDIIYANDAGMTLDGGEAGDELHGGAGADHLIGGEGSDLLYGGAGDDTFVVEDDSLVDGGDGDDVIYAVNAGELYGGAGSDTIVATNASRIGGGTGDDVINVTGSYSSVGLETGDGYDIVNVASPNSELILASSIAKSAWSVVVDLYEWTADFISGDPDVSWWTVDGHVVMTNGPDQIRFNNLQFSVRTNTDLPFDVSLIVEVTNYYLQYAADYNSYYEPLIGYENPNGYTTFADFGVV